MYGTSNSEKPKGLEFSSLSQSQATSVGITLEGTSSTYPNTDCDGSRKEPFRKTDIFLEPFEEGICIRDSLTKTHRLLFNKYPARPYHVLVITKERQKQGELLNTSDFEAAMLVMRAFGNNALLFYNSSLISGASQEHKHL
jgi:ATP adenylyltransferase/5',5'''-P-1,P-4-tetraphosphate phosphorylase II